jgi:hypothetical protein
MLSDRLQAIAIHLIQTGPDAGGILRGEPNIAKNLSAQDRLDLVAFIASMDLKRGENFANHLAELDSPEGADILGRFTPADQWNIIAWLLHAGPLAPFTWARAEVDHFWAVSSSLKLRHASSSPPEYRPSMVRDWPATVVPSHSRSGSSLI